MGGHLLGLQQMARDSKEILALYDAKGDPFFSGASPLIIPLRVKFGPEFVLKSWTKDGFCSTAAAYGLEKAFLCQRERERGRGRERETLLKSSPSFDPRIY